MQRSLSVLLAVMISQRVFSTFVQRSQATIPRRKETKQYVGDANE